MEKPLSINMVRLIPLTLSKPPRTPKRQKLNRCVSSLQMLRRWIRVGKAQLMDSRYLPCWGLSHCSVGDCEWCTGCAGDVHLCRICLFTSLVYGLKPHLCREAALNMRKCAPEATGQDRNVTAEKRASVTLLCWLKLHGHKPCFPSQLTLHLGQKVFHNAPETLCQHRTHRHTDLSMKLFTHFASYCPNLIAVNTQLPQIALV